MFKKCKKAGCGCVWDHDDAHIVKCPVCGDLNGEWIREEKEIKGSFLDLTKEFLEYEQNKQPIDHQKILKEQMLSIWKILAEHNVPKEKIFDVMKNLSLEITKILIEEHQKNY